MDIFGIMLGSYLVELLGAFVRFIYVNTMVLFNDDDFTVFSEIWSPKGNTNKKSANSECNHMVGVITLMATAVMLIIFI